ncbi:hypothetical protein JCM17960_34640 [Magnetospira thiophila]
MILRNSLIALAATVVALSFSQPASALCINNGTGTPVKVSVIDGGKFKKDVSPGVMECCDWKKANCNRGGDAFSNLKFVVTALDGPQTRTGVCRGTIPASYEIQIRQSGDKIRCVGVK